jgi:tellurite resistance protein
MAPSTAMALSLTSQWTLVACGVMAHADGVLDGEECDRLLAMVEDEADGEEYSEWLAVLGDARRLEQLLEELPPAPSDDHREILENAWTLAIVDGERTDPEAAALERIAGRLGVESVQLEFWREAWTEGQTTFARNVTEALVVILGGDAPVADDDRKLLTEFVWRLPTSNEHREELAATVGEARDKEAVARELTALPRRRRQWLLRLLAPTAHASARPDDASRRFIELADAVGVDRNRAEALLTSGD